MYITKIDGTCCRFKHTESCLFGITQKYAVRDTCMRLSFAELKQFVCGCFKSVDAKAVFAGVCTGMGGTKLPQLTKDLVAQFF